jgi:hypothetical protein
MTEYTKLSALVNSTFKLNRIIGCAYKMWDNDSRKMLSSDTPSKGYKKVYTVDTDKGVLDLSSSQFGVLLELVSVSGLADINNKTFEVKSNGQTGQEIRYFFNHVTTTQSAEPLPEPQGEIDLDGILF